MVGLEDEICRTVTVGPTVVQLKGFLDVGGFNPFKNVLNCFVTYRDRLQVGDSGFGYVKT